MSKARIWMLLRNFGIEVLIYAVLVVAYFFLVLEFLGAPLQKLFEQSLILYAFISLALIVVQGVVLEAVTSFLIRQLGLDRLD
ncbi:MAG TPA: hypothetical protein ENJ31_08310 [Anaerolineae bacterium]|nr:hypothetical protein [Anaerolineae bacterium]